MSTSAPETSLNPDLPSAASAPERIVIQGVRGAFHEIAARMCFGDHIQVVPALSFPELFVLGARPDSSDAAGTVGCRHLFDLVRGKPLLQEFRLRRRIEIESGFFSECFRHGVSLSPLKYTCLPEPKEFSYARAR